MMDSASITNSLIQAIEEFNAEEAIYWAHLLKQTRKTDATHLAKLFQGFQLGNQELSALIAHLIWEFVKHEDFPVIYEKFSNELHFGLQESCDEAVIKLCLRIIFELGLQKGHRIEKETMKLALKPIAFANYSVSSLLIQLLIESKKSVEFNINDDLLELYLKSKTDTVVQFRFFELFRSLNLEQSQLSQTLFTELKTILIEADSDPLMAANALQIIQDCIDRKEQFEIFNHEGLFDLLLNLIEASNSFLACKALDVLAHCALTECFSFENYVEPRGIHRKVLNVCEDENKKGSAIFCLVALATLSPHPQSLLTALNESFLIHSTSSVKLSAIHSLAIFFACKTQPKEVKKQFLLHLNASFGILQVLQDYINSTFDEQKSAAYFALKSILSTDLCLEFILSSSTIFAALLQRSLDDSMVGLKWKYGILEQIYSDASLFGCLNDPLKAQVTKYLGQGVTFVPKRSQVAFEAE